MSILSLFSHLGLGLSPSSVLLSALRLVHRHSRMLERLETRRLDAAYGVGTTGMQMMKIHARLRGARIVKSFKPSF